MNAGSNSHLASEQPSIHFGAPSALAQTGPSFPHALLLERRNRMLEALIVILLILWLLGFFGHYGGNLIHLLLVVVLVLLLVRLL